MTTANIPRIVLGAMAFGLDTTDAQTSACKVRGSAAVTPSSPPSLSTTTQKSTLLGSMVSTFLAGSHKENLPKQFRESLKALSATKVDILYLHAPDYSVPFEETLKAIDDLYKERLFDRFGVSNYSAWNVALMHSICKQNGYVLPTIYQGPYNPIDRSVTSELLPCFKYLNMGLYAYNPISGGVLSGKCKNLILRLLRAVDMIPRLFLARWYEECTGTAPQPHLATLLEATLRWMRHHFGLTAKDGILIGASKVEQLEETLTELDKSPLPKEMIKAFDEAWEHVQPIARSYFIAENARSRRTK
ncbi:hypothetical protein BGZ47_004124 [Haplosporangium gracile]|nr:hypothetical protein BGZ47_004124 [Haplosporangium gracile]